jgi:4-amino-4-deoxy-L-arabinose transferase-like glycosyltransferase
LSHLRHVMERMDDPQCFVPLAWVVTALALATRLIVLISFWPMWIWQSGQVQDDWNKLAINLVTSGTFGFVPDQPTIERGPIFPLLEIPLYFLFSERYAGWSIALLVLDTFTCGLLVLLGRRLWGNRAALLAGVFYAIHLPLVYYTAAIQQFTVVLPLVFLWFYFVSKWDLCPLTKPPSVALGLISGVLMLSKGVYLPVALGAAVAFLWLNWRRRGGRLVVRSLAVALLVAGLLVAPWTYRNYVVTDGKFIPVQSLFWEIIWQKFVMSELDIREGWRRPPGRTLAYFVSRQQDVFRSGGDHNASHLTGPKRELYHEAMYKRQVLEWIHEDPSVYALNIVSNMWGFWVRAENLQKTLLMAAMQTVLLGAAMMGLWFAVLHDQIHKLRFGLVLILVLWAEYSLVLGWGRFSLDTVPVLAVFFGAGVDAWLRNRNQPRLDRAPHAHRHVPSTI